MPIKYLEPSLDKWVDQANAADTNNSTTTLRMFQNNARDELTVALLKWDVVGEIPAGATIIDAYFRFWWEDFDGDADAWFDILVNTVAFNAATNWTTKPATGDRVTMWNRAELGIDDDLPTIIGYDYIRATAFRAILGLTSNPSSLVNLVQDWYSGAVTNHGVSIQWSAGRPTGDTYYTMYSVDETVEYRRPLLVIEYADGDSLPATYTDEQPGFYGSALSLLERELVPIPDMHLYLEFADGTETDLIDDWIGATGLSRNIPFLLETLELPAGSFVLQNDDGKYSKTNIDSDFFGDALVGAFIRAVVEIEGQQKVLYRGEVKQVFDSSDNTAEILCASYFTRYLDYPLTTPRSDTAYVEGGDHLGAPPGKITGYYAALIYDAFHNYAGLPEADMNINRFADVLASHTTAKEEGEQIWVKNRLDERVRDLCDAGHCKPYQDQNGDIALHYWTPTDPTTDDEVNCDSFKWWDKQGGIINELEVVWDYEYPEEVGKDPVEGNTVYTDNDSVSDNGTFRETLTTTAMRIPAQPTLAGEFYTQALGYPYKRGTLTGGAEFLRYDLGSVFWLRNDAKGIYTKVRVVGYDPRPGFNGAWSITMDVIPTNWTLPYRTFTAPGTPLISFTNNLAAPTPDSISFASETNGELTITIGWDYTADLIPPDGFAVYWNSGATAGQAVPTRESHTGKAIFPNAPWFRQFFFRVPDSHYVTIAMSALAITRRGFFESALVGSAAAPDWVDANYLGSILADSVPTNVPANLTSATNVETEVGTATVKLTWTYVQGAKIADLFFIIGNFGDGAPAAPVYGSEDWSAVLPAGSRDWTFEFPKQNKFGTFKIAAVRQTTSGYAITAWQGHANWTDIQPSAAAYDLDDITDGTNHGKILLTSTDGGGNVDLGGAGIVGDLDDITDGATHGKVELTSLNANRVDLDSADGNLDDVTDGATHGKVKNTCLTANEVDLAGVVGDLDDVTDGVVYEKVKATSLDGGGNVDLGGAGIVGDLDDITDGAIHGKVELATLTGNRVDLSKADGDLDDVSDGGTYEKVKATSLDGGGNVDLGGAGIVGDIDDIDEGAVYGKTTHNEVTGADRGYNALDGSYRVVDTDNLPGAVAGLWQQTSYIHDAVGGTLITGKDDVVKGWAWIRVAEHEVQFPHGDKTYNTGDIGTGAPGLAFETLYYVYCIDPGLEGGAVTYYAVTDWQDVMAQTDGYYVGSVTTPADGGGDTGGEEGGGGGPQE